MKNFYHVLFNTLIANITTGFLWFALTFWVYLETKSVLATGIIGGSYMLFVALFSIPFGTIVDKIKKKEAMLRSSAVTLLCFVLAGLLYYALKGDGLLDLSRPYFWLFVGLILFGAVIENMRNIALSTTVTLLVPKDRRANANGLVGAVQGISFIITSVFSGLAIGFIGMGWTMVVAIVLTAVALVHLLTVSVPEKGVAHDPELENKKIDIAGSLAAIHLVPGLMGLIIFSTFNNFIGGAYVALMDPYGLEMFSVEQWGLVFGVAGTGFIVGGGLVAKFGLGKNPIRTMLYLVMAMGFLGAMFTIREWWWLYALGIWIYMLMIPAVEASEQTVIQRVVPYERQGRVFGFAQAFEASASPLTAFLIAPIAEFIIIPYMNRPEGQQAWGWLLGEGDARGIALVFFFCGLIMVAVSILAFFTKTYSRISAHYSKT